MATITVVVPERIKEALVERISAKVSITSQVVAALEAYLKS